MSDSQQLEYPIFLSSKPIGEDKFEGRSQEKIANNIVDIIVKDYYSPKVIGLEGSWGSGKSNVVEQIKNKLPNSYHLFVFDAWGNQEDLTRKSFLEQLLSELTKADCIGNTDKLKEINKELFAKTSTRHKEVFPSIKSYWVLISTAILSFAFLNGLYDLILSKINVVKAINFGIAKPLISIYLIPIVLFVWGIFLIKNEFKKVRSKDSSKSNFEIIGILLYWFNGKEIESTEREITLDDEPSVYKFKEYFQAIETEAKAKEKHLVIVFDNLDRLEREKVKSLWSSIHTFFSDSNNNVDSWVIIPYYRNELIQHLGFADEANSADSFIEKSIPINFRITPPVVQEWEAYFNEKLKEAFGDIDLKNLEISSLRNTFDSLIETNIITPRQIIKYINDIVTLFKQWQSDIKEGGISIVHLGLFALTKNEILKSPNEQILSREYLGKAKFIFEFDDNLDNIVSALTFGVPINIADEVLLYRNISMIIKEANASNIKLYANHKSFALYFRRAYYSIPIKEKINQMPSILGDLKETLSSGEIENFWKNCSNEMLSIDELFNEFSDLHRQILKNVNDNTVINEVIRKIIVTIRSKVNNENDSQKLYVETILSLEEYTKELSLPIDIGKYLQKVELNPDNFLLIIKKRGAQFLRYGISCEENLLSSYFYDNDDLNLTRIIDLLEELKVLKRDSSHRTLFKQLLDSTKEKLKISQYSEIDIVKNNLKVAIELGERPVSLKFSSDFYSDFDSASFEESDSYYDCFCIAISDFENSINGYSKFQSTLNELTKEDVTKVSSRLEQFFSYQDLLRLLVNNSTARSYAPLKAIALEITNNSFGVSLLNLDWALKNFSNIVTLVFDSKPGFEADFLNRINHWVAHFKTPIENIDPKIFKHLDKQDIKLIEEISKKAITYYAQLKKEDYLDSFKNANSFQHLLLKSLVSNNLIKSFNDNFYSAYDDFMKGIAKGEVVMPSFEMWDKFIDLLNGKKLISYYTSLRDYFADHDDMSEDEINFFESGLIRYGNLKIKSNEMSLKFILPMIKSDKCFETIFLNNSAKLIPIVNQSVHKETIIGELKLKNQSDKYKNNETMIKIADEIKL